ncbi:MAG: hypothetical protein U1A77_26440 [Pirellulales bacterium]
MEPTSLFRMFVAVLVIAGAVPSLAAEKPTIQDILATKASFESGNDSFESVLVALATKVKMEHPDFRIKILGDDLKFEGITKNQRIRGLKLKDKTVAEVLTAIVLEANPNSLVKDPRDPRQALVWVIATDPDQLGIPSILITTRDAATKRTQKLPQVFERD